MNTKTTEKKSGQIRIGIVGPRTVGKTTYIATLLGYTHLENLTLTAKEEGAIEKFRSIWNEIEKGVQAPRNEVGILPAINFTADLDNLSFGNVEFVDSAGEVFNIGAGLSSKNSADTAEKNLSTNENVEKNSNNTVNSKDDSSADKNYAAYSKYAQTLRDLLETCDAVILFIEAPERSPISQKSIATHPTLKLFLNSIENNRTGKIKKPVAIIVAKSDRLVESDDIELNLPELEAKSRALFAGQIEGIERMCQTVGVFPISVFRETIDENKKIVRGEVSATGISRPIIFLLNEIEKMHSILAEEILNGGTLTWEQADEASGHIMQLAEPSKKGQLNILLQKAYDQLKACAFRKIAIFSLCSLFLTGLIYEIAWPFYLLNAVLPSKLAGLNYDQAIQDCDSFLSLPHTGFSNSTVAQAQKNIAEKLVLSLIYKGMQAKTHQEVSSIMNQLLPVFGRFFQDDNRFKTDVSKLHHKAKELGYNDALLQLNQLAFSPANTPEEIKKLQENIQQIAKQFTESEWHKKVEKRENEIILAKITSYLRSKIDGGRSTMADVKAIRESWGSMPGVNELFSEIESSLNSRIAAIVSVKISEIEAFSKPQDRWEKIKTLQKEYPVELSQENDSNSPYYHVSKRFSKAIDETIAIETRTELIAKFGQFINEPLRLGDYTEIDKAVQECEAWNSKKKQKAAAYIEKVKKWLEESRNEKIEIWLKVSIPKLNDTKTDFWEESKENRRVEIKYETSMKIDVSNRYAKLPEELPGKETHTEFLFCRIPVDSMAGDMTLTVAIKTPDDNEINTTKFKIGDRELMKTKNFSLTGDEAFDLTYRPTYEKFDIKIE